MLQYIYERAELKNKEAFFDLITTKISPDVGEKIMTLAEQMREEGKIEGETEIAKRLLNENLDLLFISKMTGLSLNKLKILQTKADVVN